MKVQVEIMLQVSGRIFGKTRICPDCERELGYLRSDLLWNSEVIKSNIDESKEHMERQARLLLQLLQMLGFSPNPRCSPQNGASSTWDVGFPSHRSTGCTVLKQGVSWVRRAKLPQSCAEPAGSSPRPVLLGVKCHYWRCRGEVSCSSLDVMPKKGVLNWEVKVLMERSLPSNKLGIKTSFP